MPNLTIINKKIKKFEKQITVDGDKSISIRWVLFSSLASGVSKAKNLLMSEDVIASLKSIRKLGINFKISKNDCTIYGKGLSFLFALQKYKPSPFYALDEVDSFLDGINVERLSKLISNQSSNAQFIVVSHRRPMISSSERTIGVAQARGANTQVVGLPNAA